MGNNSERAHQSINEGFNEKIEEEKSQVNNVIQLNNQIDAKCKSPDKILTIEQLLLGENGRKCDLAYYTQVLSNLVSIRREIHASSNIFSRELKNKIEQTMDLTPNAISISKLLSQILSDAVTFNKRRHSKLIKLLIDTLKDLGKPDTAEFRLDNEAKVLREIIIDFLFRIKDKHPFSDLVERKIMDVFDIIMEFLFGYSFKPSAALIKEYSESKLTRKFNTLPPREYLNSIFECQISEEDYERFRKRLESRPPFVFYFNPSIEIQEKEYKYFGLLNIGFFAEATDNQIGAGMWVNKRGDIYQGYLKNGWRHVHGRIIYSNGNIYEGGFDMDNRHGKGEWENMDGRVEIGQWVEDDRQGHFECYDQNGLLTYRKIYEDDQENQCEYVKLEIYGNK